MFHVSTLLIVEERTLSLSIKESMGLLVQFGLVERKNWFINYGLDLQKRKEKQAEKKRSIKAQGNKESERRVQEQPRKKKKKID